MLICDKKSWRLAASDQSLLFLSLHKLGFPRWRQLYKNGEVDYRGLTVYGGTLPTRLSPVYSLEQFSIEHRYYFWVTQSRRLGIQDLWQTVICVRFRDIRAVMRVICSISFHIIYVSLSFPAF